MSEGYAKYICEKCDIVVTKGHIIIRGDTGYIDVLKFVNAEFIYLESLSELRNDVSKLLFSQLHCVIEEDILVDLENILDHANIDFIRS